MLRKTAILLMPDAPPREAGTGRFTRADQQPPDDPNKPKQPEGPKTTAAGENLIQELASDFLDVPPEERKPVKPKDEKPKPKVEKPPKPAPKKAAPVAAPSAESIATAVSEGVSRALSTAKPTDTKPAPEEPELPDANKAQLPVLERMEQLYPDKYKGITQKYKDSYTKLKAYAKEWEEKHPGETFDEDAEEHNDFFDKNVPNWDDGDFTDARADIIADQKVEAKLKPVNAKLSEYDRKQKLEAEMPKIVEEQVRHGQALWKSFGEEFGALFKEDGTLDLAKFNELAQKDPVIHGIRLQVANALNSEIEELYKVYNGLADFNEKDPVHVNIEKFAAQLESDVSKMDEAERTDENGRAFLPQAEYWKRHHRNKKDTEEKFWTLGVRDIAEARAKDLSKMALKAIAAKEKELDAWSKARGLQPRERAPKPAQNSQQEEERAEETPVEDDGKPQTPSAADAPNVAVSRAAKAKGTSDPVSAIFSGDF